MIGMESIDIHQASDYHGCDVHGKPRREYWQPVLLTLSSPNVGLFRLVKHCGLRRSCGQRKRGYLLPFLAGFRLITSLSVADVLPLKSASPL